MCFIKSRFLHQAFAAQPLLQGDNGDNRGALLEKMNLEIEVCYIVETEREMRSPGSRRVAVVSRLLVAVEEAADSPVVPKMSAYKPLRLGFGALCAP